VRLEYWISSLCVLFAAGLDLLLNASLPSSSARTCPGTVPSSSAGGSTRSWTSTAHFQLISSSANRSATCDPPRLPLWNPLDLCLWLLLTLSGLLPRNNGFSPSSSFSETSLPRCPVSPSTSSHDPLPCATSSSSHWQYLPSATCWLPSPFRRPHACHLLVAGYLRLLPFDSII
jgi:hypothetical protein